MVSSFFSTFCSISILLGALISAGFQRSGNMAAAAEEVDSKALLPFGGSVFGDFIRCGGSRSTIAAQSVGVCYGGSGNNLPNMREVVDLYKSNGIRKMRIYTPHEAIFNALRGSNIQVTVGILNDDIQSLTDPATATNWVQKNIQAFIQDIKFRYIVVGNVVPPTDAKAAFVLPAIQNIQNAIVAANLQDKVKVSTAIHTNYLNASSFPPHAGSFYATANQFMTPIISFLVKNVSPLLANVYPYSSYVGDQESIKLSYALFTSPDVVVRDGNLEYRNLFDALVDTLYSALEKSGGVDVPIVVSDSGWPSEGGTAATIENAGTYYRNLISHVKSGKGTPKRPGKAIETYLFAMFDENLKGPEETEKHFGLFTPSKQPKYELSFN